MERCSEWIITSEDEVTLDPNDRNRSDCEELITYPRTNARGSLLNV